jgi:hypothetical protein
MTISIRSLLVGTAIASTLLLTAPASAGNLGFEFNNDGVLPSSQGAFYTTTAGTPEADVFSASGGLLRQGGFSTANPNDAVGYRGEVAYDPTQPATWEWRLRLLHPIDIVKDGIGIQSNIDVGGRVMTTVIRTTAVAISGANPVSLFFDVGTGFHDYLVEFNPGASHFDFFFDGQLLLSDDVSVPSGVHPGALFYWLGGQDSQAEWDFVRFRNGAAVPLPSAAFLLALGALALALARRRGVQ